MQLPQGLAQPRQRRGADLGYDQRTEAAQMGVQPIHQGHEMAAVARELALGTGAQVHDGAFGFARGQRLHQQARVIDQVLAGQMRRLLVLLEPQPQLARG